MDSLAAEADEIARDELAARNALPGLLGMRRRAEKDVSVDEDGEGLGTHVADMLRICCLTWSDSMITSMPSVKSV